MNKKLILPSVLCALSAAGAAAGNFIGLPTLTAAGSLLLFFSAGLLFTVGYEGLPSHKKLFRLTGLPYFVLLFLLITANVVYSAFNGTVSVVGVTEIAANYLCRYTPRVFSAAPEAACFSAVASGLLYLLPAVFIACFIAFTSCRLLKKTVPAALVCLLFSGGGIAAFFFADSVLPPEMTRGLIGVLPAYLGALCACGGIPPVTEAETLPEIAASGRDKDIDLMRALLIVLMMIGHHTTDYRFNSTVYSIHMAAFVIVSGYFYSPVKQGELGAKLKKLPRALEPYTRYAVLFLLFSGLAFADRLKSLVLAMSASDKLLTGISAVGPIWFVPMLFCVKLIVTLIDGTVRSTPVKAILFTALAVAGYFLGTNGVWLPWSLDCALFSLLFFFMGFFFKTTKTLQKAKNNPGVIFILLGVWSLLLYKGGFRLGGRGYSDPFLSAAGVAAAFIVLYLLCGFASDLLPGFIVRLVCRVGESTGWILVIHSIFSPRIVSALGAAGLAPENVFNLGAAILLQTVAGCLVHQAETQLKAFIKKRKKRGSV